MSTLRILELTSSLTSSDPRLQLQTVEAMVKAVRSEGFARLQLNTGIKVTKEKSFPSLFTPLVQGLLKLLSAHDTPASGGSGGGSGDVSLQFSKSISQILYLLCRANKAFSKWVYTVPKFVAIYLRAIRALQVTDVEISMRLLKTLQHILSLERKAALVVRLEGGIKTLMQCIGNGGGGSATLNNRRNDTNAGVACDSGISQAMAFSNAVASNNANNTSSSSSSSAASSSASSASSLSTTSTVHQKFLRILIEVLLVVLKHNEHNSTAIVTQSLPYLSNLFHVLRNQQGHVKIFTHALQILEKLCKEKKIINAILGTPPPSAVPKDTSDDGSQPPPAAPTASSAILTTLPPNSPAVQALLAVLGPNVNSFMTWCMLTLLNNKFEAAAPVLNVLLRLIFQLASSKIGFTTLLANGGVEALLPAIQSQLHKRATVRATTALIWQSQRQQYGHLVPKVDPLYKFHEAGLKVFFTADGRVLKEAEWEAERAVLKAKKAAAAAAAGTSSNAEGAAELEAELENEATAIEAAEELDDAEEITTAADDETSLAAGEPAASGSPPTYSAVSPSLASSNDFASVPTTIVSTTTEFVNNDDDNSGGTGGAAGEDGDNENEGGGERAQAGSDEDEADEGDEAGAKSGISDSEGDDLDSGDEAPKPKKKVTVVKKTAEVVIQTALPTPIPSSAEIERVKALLLQTIAAANSVSQININPDGTAAISPVPLATSSSAPSAAPSTSNSPTAVAAATAAAAPKLGLSLDDQTLGWNCSPELWDPEDPETAKRIAANLDEVKHAQYNAPKSVSPFIMPTPYLPYYEDERGRRVPGVLQQNKNEPLLETNPSILIEKMLQSTQRFTHPSSFMGRVVYDKDAGGSLLHLLPPTPTTSDSNSSSVSPPPGSSPIVVAAAASGIVPPALPSPSSTPPPRASPSRSPAASKKAGTSASAAKTKETGAAAAPSSASKLGVEGSRKILSAGRTAALKTAAATKTVTSSSSSSGNSTPASPATGLKRRATAPTSRSSGKTPLTPVAPSNPSMRVGSASAVQPSPLIISNTISSSPIPSPSLASRTNRANATFAQQQNAMPVPPLHFESRFEGGNLHRVVQVSETTYDLVLSTDVNSRGHTQWFFFQIKQAVPNVTYQFNMLNLEKNHSTFNTGMKPVMFSAKLYEQNKIGWHRAMNVDEVAYYHSFHRRPYDEASGKLKVGTDKQNVNEDDEDAESGAEGVADGDEGDGSSSKKKSQEDDATAEKPKKKLLKKKVLVKKKVKKADAPSESPDESPARSRSISPIDDSAQPNLASKPLLHSPVRSASSSVIAGAEETAADEERVAARASSTASTDSLASEIRALKLQGSSDTGTQSVPVTSRAASAASGSATARVTSPNAPASGHSGLIEIDMTPAPKRKILKKKVGTKGKLSARGSKDKESAGDSAGGASTAPKKKKKILKKGKKPASDCFYTLTFSIRFPHADDTILLAYHYPFTYSFQRECLDHLYQTTSLTNQCLRRQKLCSTRGGNCCEVLTITEFARSKFELDAVRKRKLVFLSARIHPGECNSSWVMKGLLEFLTSKDETAVWLRSNMVFKIVPMLNIDGVIEGNHRTSLSGVDLNRHWDEPSPIIHPTLYYTRKLLLALAVNRSLLLYCDFHGHSAMKNMCLYGCDINKSEGGLGPFPLHDQLHFKHVQEALTLSPETMNVVTGVATSSIAGGSAASAAALLRTSSLTANNGGSNEGGMFAASLTRRSSMPAAPHASPNFDASAMTVPSNPFASLPTTLTPNALAVLAAPLVVEYRAGHVFPELLARRPEVGGRYFNHAACAFHVRKDKAGTARVVFWRALRHWDVFTFEASFAGGTLGDMKNQHFQPWHYEDMGLRFLETLKELHRLRKEKQQLIQQFVAIEQNKPTTPGPSNVPNSPPNVVVASNNANV